MVEFSFTLFKLFLMQWNSPQWRHIGMQFLSKTARGRSRTLIIVKTVSFRVFFLQGLPIGYLADISEIWFGLLREPKGLYTQVQDVWWVVWHTDTQQIGGSICPSVSGGHLSLSLSGCDTVNPSWFSVSHLFFFFLLHCLCARSNEDV